MGIDCACSSSMVLAAKKPRKFPDGSTTPSCGEVVIVSVAWGARDELLRSGSVWVDLPWLAICVWLVTWKFDPAVAWGAPSV